MLLTSASYMVAFTGFDRIDTLLTQPLLVVAGSEAGSLWHSQELYARAAATQKELFIIDGATHMDLYDGPGVGPGHATPDAVLHQHPLTLTPAGRRAWQGCSTPARPLGRGHRLRRVSRCLSHNMIHHQHVKDPGPNSTTGGHLSPSRAF